MQQNEENERHGDKAGEADYDLQTGEGDGVAMTTQKWPTVITQKWPTPVQVKKI